MTKESKSSKTVRADEKGRRGRPRRNQEIDSGPTPETAAKLEPDTLIVLVERNLLTSEQEAAGRELHAMWRALRRGMLPQSKTTPSAPIPGAKQYRTPIARMSEGEAAVWSKRYKPWADAESRIVLCRQPPLSRMSLVRKVVEDNAAPRALAHLLAVSEGQVVEQLCTSLDFYARQRKVKILLT